MPEENEVSISAAAHALLALEEEISQLSAEAERHYTKLMLAMRKMEICRQALNKIITKSVGRVVSETPDPKFPELRNWGAE